MTQQQFIDWLNDYLAKCEKEQISLIKEKLALVNARAIGYNYISMLDKEKTSVAGEKLNWTVDNTNGTFSTEHIDTLTGHDPHL